jgi:two-component system response regulator GlrR
LLEQVARALRTSGFSDTVEHWRAAFATRSPLVEDRLAKAYLVAGTDSAVLITGDPGSGKELLGRAIHRASTRSEARFVAIDCSALDADAVRSEVALDEALARASGGTIFLRSVNDLPPSLQARLARRLEGADLRVLAASDRRPDEFAMDGRFSRELLDRLSAVHIDLPPLQKRREDIPLLVAQCLEEFSAETSQPKRTMAPEAMEALAAAKWPGNVRQLRMVVRQVAAIGAGPVITLEQVLEAQGKATQLPSFDEARDEFTRGYLVQLLQITQGNVSQAARLAKRNRTDFYKLLTKHNLRPEEFKE